MAERVGFEPTSPFGRTAFRERRLKPLGNLSVTPNLPNQPLINDQQPKLARTTQGLAKGWPPSLFELGWLKDSVVTRLAIRSLGAGWRLKPLGNLSIFDDHSQL